MSGFFGGPSMANMMNDPRYKKQVADAFNPAISTMNVSPTGGTGVPGQKKETLAIKAGDANISQNNTGPATRRSPTVVKTIQVNKLQERH